MIIETKRLILREYRYSDYDGLKSIICDSETMKFYPRPYAEFSKKNSYKALPKVCEAAQKACFPT